MIADLHCDLLLYLDGGPDRKITDRRARCSLPQLQEGGVKLQVLPIFAETASGSSLAGRRQVKIFEQLPAEHFNLLNELKIPKETIGVRLAIENASAFCAEEDSLEEQLAWLEKLPYKPLYISFTWNTENRFGGGAHTQIGLKRDGEKLLDFLHQRKICVDLSHTSDRLARDILERIDRRNLEIPVIASHSNFRAVADVPRNLPDDLAREVIRRGGVIGLNFVGLFVGKSPDALKRHVEHALSLGAEDQLCFGADFYFTEDLAPQFRRDFVFFEGLDHAGVYPALVEKWQREGISVELIDKMSWKNLLKLAALDSH